MVQDRAHQLAERFAARQRCRPRTQTPAESPGIRTVHREVRFDGGLRGGSARDREGGLPGSAYVDALALVALDQALGP